MSNPLLLKNKIHAVSWNTKPHKREYLMVKFYPNNLFPFSEICLNEEFEIIEIICIIIENFDRIGLYRFA